MRENFLCILMFSFLAVGCTGKNGGTRDSGDLVDFTSKTEYQTLASLGRCPTSQEAVFELLVGSAITVGLNRIGSAIRAAGSESTETVLANRLLQFNEVDMSDPTQGICLLVARGDFFTEFDQTSCGRSLGECYPSYAREYAAVDSDFRFDRSGRVLQQLFEDGLPLAKTPDFFFYGNVRCLRAAGEDASANSTTSEENDQGSNVGDDGHAGESSNSSKNCQYATLTPREAFLRTPIDDTSWGNGDRNVAISFAITNLSKPADLSKGQGVVLQLGNLQAGNTVEYRRSDEMPNAQVFLRSDQLDPGAEPNLIMLSPDMSEAFEFPQHNNLYRLQVLISETKGEVEYLTFLAEVLGGASEGLSTNLATSLIPTLDDEAEEQEMQVREAALNKYDDSLAKVEVALSNCLATTSRATALAARIAIRNFNQAKRQLDALGDYPTLNNLQENGFPTSSEDTEGFLDYCESGQDQIN